MTSWEFLNILQYLLKCIKRSEAVVQLELELGRDQQKQN